jgi:hypothetical protein
VSDPLRSIPGVGPRTAEDLRTLGIGRPDDLVGRDPERLYARLCAAHGGHSDRCNLYVYRCAVYFAEGGRDPELLKWWSWKDAARPPIERLRAGRAPRSRSSGPAQRVAGSGLPKRKTAEPAEPSGNA